MTKRNTTRDAVTDLFRKFAGQVNNITIPRPYIDLCGGDHLAALLLSQILYWSDRTEDENGWFAKSYEEWHEELAMTQYQVTRAINGDKRNKTASSNLKQFGVETKLKPSKYHAGAATLHYRVNLEKLEAAVINFVNNGVVNIVDNPVINIVDNAPSTLSITYTETTTETTTESLSSSDELNSVRAKKPRKANPYFDAIKQVFGIEAGGWVGNLEAMMKGKAKRGEWQRCNFEPPVTDPQEILDFEPYLKRRMAEKNLKDKPTACVTIQRWFYDYRAEKQKHATQKRVESPKTDYELIPILFLREMEQEQAAAARAAAELEKVAS